MLDTYQNESEISFLSMLHDLNRGHNITIRFIERNLYLILNCG
jgi:hypothetical protein